MSGNNRTPALTVPEFRATYPVFGNADEFPDDTIELWIQRASNMLDPLVWKDLWRMGVEYFTAHNLVIGQRLATSNAKGQAGLELSKTVGKVSVDYDTTATSMKGGGPFNATTWGTQFLFYAQMVGSGPIQITGPMWFPPAFPVALPS